MPRKKRSPAPSTATKTSALPPASKKTPPTTLNARQQPDNRWQRSKRYGWDGR